ncbi:hypothetical protein EO244_09020 [Ancylomarina salipaludis]|uniref:DUF4440 domain-containing protein n=1 Tax=Ancylomarina salipaludis TaxID=2501299 RepID=A0A4Q1JM78_9BACT|nr:hypothetical protein [Ancylomarina salipaludis]RXQ94414.1 hypothetical protein EO244_09020 [Ancylomarina salipaludis]
MPNKNCIQICLFLILTWSLISCGRSTSLIDACNSVLETDRAFSAYSQEYGMAESFYKYASSKAVMLRDNSYPIIGNEKIKTLLSSAEKTNHILTWEPQYADVSSSMDMAYTYGYYKYITPDSTYRGCYVSIWKKDINNQWKFVFDAGSSGLGKEKSE